MGGEVVYGAGVWVTQWEERLSMGQDRRMNGSSHGYQAESHPTGVKKMLWGRVGLSYANGKDKPPYRVLHRISFTSQRWLFPPCESKVSVQEAIDLCKAQYAKRSSRPKVPLTI